MAGRSAPPPTVRAYARWRPAVLRTLHRRLSARRFAPSPYAGAEAPRQLPAIPRCNSIIRIPKTATTDRRSSNEFCAEFAKAYDDVTGVWGVACCRGVKMHHRACSRINAAANAIRITPVTHDRMRWMRGTVSHWRAASAPSASAPCQIVLTTIRARPSVASCSETSPASGITKFGIIARNRNITFGLSTLVIAVVRRARSTPIGSATH